MIQTKDELSIFTFIDEDSNFEKNNLGGIGL